MSATTNLERTLATWLERDGPADVPERVITAALAEARTVGQRRAWLTRAWWTTRASREAGVMGSTRSIDDLARPLRLVWIVALIGLLLAATALVALVGSELVRRSDDRSVLVPVPASPSPAPESPSPVPASPSPASTERLLAGMVTEEIEPGVFRVTSDGVRDLTSVEAVDIVAGYDGGIWLLSADEFLRLGSEGSHGWPMNSGAGPEDHVFEVAPDGTMWLIQREPVGFGPFADARDGAGLRSTDGEAWALQSCPGGWCYGLTVAPDGTVWATYYDVDGKWVGRLGPTGWEPLYEAGSREADRLFPTEAGVLYGVEYMTSPQLLRHEGSYSWERLCGDLGQLPCSHTFDAGRDGSLWATGYSPDGASRLARYADGRWSEFTLGHLFAVIGSILGLDDQFRVAPDGSVWSSLWSTPDGELPQDDDWSSAVCDGVARFDRQTLERFLPGRCISLDVAPDGSVWVLATPEQVWAPDIVDDWAWEVGRTLTDAATWDLYVITPEAVAASQ